MTATLDLLNTRKAAALSLGNGVSRETEPDGITFVPLRKIYDNPYQPRGRYDAEHILNLALSIKALKGELPATRGLQQMPLARVVFRQGETWEIAPRAFYGDGNANRLVEVRSDAAVQLMFGHSRYRAFQVLAQGIAAHRRTHGATLGLNWAGLAEVETRFRDLLEPDADYATMPLMLGFALDHAMWQHAITENSQRKNITAIEEAQSIKRAMDEFGLNTEEAGKPFGYERSTTANKVRLLQLPEDVQKKITAGELSERHGRELLRVVEDPARVQKLAEMAVKNGLPVRKLAENVKWEEDGLKREQEKARQLAAARALLANGWRTPADQPMPPDRVQSDTDWSVYRFDTDDPKDRLLISQNGCGPHCACFVLTYYDGYGLDKRYRPDPTTMPNICLSCRDREAYNTQCAALGKVDDDSEEARVKREQEAERKRKIELLNNAAHTIWQRWLKEQDLHTLWNSLAFWRQACKAVAYGFNHVFAEAPDLPTACAKLLQAMYRDTREYSHELREYVHVMAKVEGLIEALRGVSRETEEFAGIEQVVEEIESEESDE